MLQGTVAGLVRYPFRAEPWIEGLSLVVQPLTGLMALVLLALGRRSTAAAVLRRPLPGRRPDHPGGAAPLGRDAVVRLVPGIVVAAVAAYALSVPVVNWAYPLRPDTDDLSGVWGGPTLAGAWAVHAAGATLLLWVIAPLLHGLYRGTAHLAGAPGGGGRRATGPADRPAAGTPDRPPAR